MSPSDICRTSVPTGYTASCGQPWPRTRRSQCGTALFLLGYAALRAVLGTGRVRDRLIGAAAAVPLGWATSFAGWAPMAAMTAVLETVAVIDRLTANGPQPPGDADTGA